MHAAGANGPFRCVAARADTEIRTNLPEDDAGWTAFHCACVAGHRVCIRMLLGAGCDPLAKTDRGRMGLDYAKERGRKEAIVVIEERLGELKGEMQVAEVAREQARFITEDERGSCTAELQAAYPSVLPSAVTEVVEANKYHGQYDFAAAMKALRVGTRNNLLTQPRLSAAAMLWRSVIFSAAKTHLSIDTARNAEASEQEWRRALDRGLHPLQAQLELDVGGWLTRHGAFLARSLPLPASFGEELDFVVETLPPAVEVCCIGRPPGTKYDAVVARTVVQTAVRGDGDPLPKDEGWVRDEWFVLESKDGVATNVGELRVELKWNPNPDQLQMLQLRVIVLSAKDLPKMDVFGANDAYVEVVADGITRRTTTVDGGGPAPAWGGGKGETLEFEISQTCRSLQVRCLDDDVGSADDEIGATIFKITSRLRDGGAWTRQEWLDLRQKGKGASGSVNVIMQCWNPMREAPPPLPPIRHVEVIVLAARKLPKMDTFGENDPYVSVTLSGVMQRTATIDGGGATPVWGHGFGEALHFESSTAPENIILRCLDEDVGSADDDMGMGVLDLRPLMKLTLWDQDAWVPLLNKHKQPSGDVHILVRCHNPIHDPAPEPPNIKMLRVTVFSGNDLPKMDLMGDNDPYCVVSVDGVGMRSPTVDGGGASPVWGAGAGEFVEFFITQIPHSIIVECFDEDVGADDLIGQSLVKIHKEPPKRRWIRDETSVLRNKSTGKVAGTLELQAEWFPLLPPTARRMLTVTVTEAKGLAKMAIFSKNDPYCTVRVGPETQRTRTIKSGGAAVKWGGEGGEVMYFDLDVRTVPRISVQVFDEDFMSADDEIGTATLDLKKMAVDEEWKHEEWVELSNSKGKNTGSVHVLLEWAPDPPLPARRYLRATVKSANKLQKMDTFGKDDPYCHLTVAGNVQRTRTIVDGGSSPVWDEALDFDLDVCRVPKVEVRCFDEDAGSADDEIGCFVLNLTRLPQTEAWSEEEVVTLHNSKGKACGQVDLLLEWLPEPPLPERRYLRVTVVAGKDLKKMDTFGQDDPYCHITVAGELGKENVMERTRTIVDGGSSPVFDEVLDFDLEVSRVPKVEVRCFDEDAGSADDETGCCFLNLNTRSPTEAWTDDQWVTLADKKGNGAGQVHVVLEWTPEPPLPTRRYLRATVFAAKDLKKMDTFGKDDPYCMLTLAGQDEQRTETIVDGGSSPEWNEVLDFDLEVARIPKIEVRCFDEDAGSADDEIGCYILNLNTQAPAEAWVYDEWVTLQNNKGNDVGEVHLKFEWTPDPPLPQRRYMKLTVVSAKDLQKMDTFGKDDPYCQVTVAGDVQRTRTIEDGGSSPLWEEVLDFDLEVPRVPKVEVRCFDEDKGSADDEIGSAVLNLSSEPSTSPWKREEVAILRNNKGKVTGTVCRGAWTHVILVHS